MISHLKAKVFVPYCRGVRDMNDVIGFWNRAAEDL
jgi:hypothetical protein